MPAELELSKLKRKHFGIHNIKADEFCITGEINSHMSEFFRSRDISVRPITPIEHDRLNAIIGIGHFVGLSLGKFLTKREKEVLAGIGSGSKLVALMDHLDGNSPTTWHETQIDNLFTKERRKDLLDALIEYDKALSRGEYPFGDGSEHDTEGDTVNRVP